MFVDCTDSNSTFQTDCGALERTLHRFVAGFPQSLPPVTEPWKINQTGQDGPYFKNDAIGVALEFRLRGDLTGQLWMKMRGRGQDGPKPAHSFDWSDDCVLEEDQSLFLQFEEANLSAMSNLRAHVQCDGRLTQKLHDRISRESAPGSTAAV